MTDKARKMSRTKLIMGIIIPVFVMIASLIMVGSSFAWFSDSATTEIRTIDLTVKKAFVLEFSVDANDTSTIYSGEKALDNNGHLRSAYQKYASGLTGDAANEYMADAPFMFKTTVGLSTQGVEADLNMHFNFVQIQQYANRQYDEHDVFVPENSSPYDLVIYGDYEAYGYTPVERQGETLIERDMEYVPFAFTWFFVEKDYTLQTALGQNHPVYTPYGKMELATENGYLYATKLNGTSVTNSTSILGTTPSGISHFSAEKDANDDNQQFDFYVVFAPQELFWAQFLPADRASAIGSVYSAANISAYVTGGANDRMFYAATEFIGATFYFTAQIDVGTVYWEEE